MHIFGNLQLGCNAAACYIVMAKIFRPGPVCIPKVIKQPLGPVGVVGGGECFSWDGVSY